MTVRRCDGHQVCFAAGGGQVRRSSLIYFSDIGKKEISKPIKPYQGQRKSPGGGCAICGAVQKGPKRRVAY